jgi:hypothetical protein
MSKERLVTALIVDAVILTLAFQGEMGRILLEQNPTAGRVAVGLGIAACSVGTWKYLKKPDRGSDKDKRRLWSLVAFVTAILVAFWHKGTPSVPFIAVGFFLLFALVKLALHG